MRGTALYNTIIFIMKMLVYFDTSEVYLQNHLKGGGLIESGIPDTEESAVKNDPVSEEEGSFKAFFTALSKAISDGLGLIKKMFMAVVMFFVYASLYPAIPFFAVLAGGLATLKYIFFKFRKL